MAATRETEMDRILTGMSAFRYHRIPPQVLALYPPLPEAFEDPRHNKIAQSPIVEDLLGTPVHRLMPSGYKATASKLYRTHVVSRELPFGSVVDTEHGFQVASPALALLTLAGELSRGQLLMAAYELCGTYSAFAPSARTEGLIAEAVSHGSLSGRDGWQRVIGSGGRPLNLWKRAPLLGAEELAWFLEQAQGLHGVKRLRWAASHVTGTCASPFEAQVSILLGLPKTSGGLGVRFENNRRIALSGQAQQLYQRSCCYADLFFEEDAAHPPVALECQGASVHSGEAAALSDAARTAALQLMGVDVIPVTHEQIKQPESWVAVKQLLAKRLGASTDKTSRQLRTETILRHELLGPAVV